MSLKTREISLPDHEWTAKSRAIAKMSMPTEDEWADLITGMLWLAELEKKGISNPMLPDGATAATGCLQLLLKLFMPGEGSSGIAQEARQILMTSGAFWPLMKLHSAINDLANGRKSPLFEPKNKNERGGNPGSSVDGFLQGMAARALKELQEAEEEQDWAAKRVAHAYNSGAKKNVGATSRQPIAFETVKNWKDRLNPGRPGPGASESAIRHFKAPLPKEWGNSPKMKGEILLGLLRSRLWLVG